MELEARIKINDLLFFSALSLYMIEELLDASLYGYMLPDGWTRILNGAVLGILVIKWLLCEEYTGKKLLIWIGVFFVLLILAITNGYLNIFVVFSLIFSAQDIKFENILKCTALILSSLTIFIICSCGLGILEDYTYEHSIAILVNTAHSLGYKYYSTLGFIAMTISAIYLYLNRYCGYIKLIILALLNTVFYFIHTTTLSIIFAYFMIAAYIVTVKWGWFKCEWKIWDYIALLMPIVFFASTVGIVFIYAVGAIRIDIPFLNTIVARLDYSIQAIDEYGIHLFGSQVEMYGNTALFYGNAESGFYIDSGYIYTLIAYGVIISVITVILYSVLFHYVYMLHDAYTYLWLTGILGICVINNFVFSILDNPLLFLMAKALFDVYKEQSKELARDIDEPAKCQEKLCL